MSDWTLTVNAGSSSLKVAAFVGDERVATSDHADLDAALAELARAGAPAIVSHRLVHGGTKHRAPVVLDDAVLAELDAVAPLAPLHVPPALALVRRLRERYPHAKHVACFDTAFFEALPDEAVHLALPERFHEVRRYGFHGLSYESVVAQLGALQPRAILAHLGSGASVATVASGVPIDASMGFTPLGGLVMGTRPGDLDPGICTYLLETKGLGVSELARVLSHESGLLALAGESDTRKLLERRSDDPRADLALRVFARSVRKAIGAAAALLGGVDLLVFTGGIGEHQAAVRAEITETLAYLGIELDPARNESNSPRVGAGTCDVRILRAEEDRMLARHAAAAGH